MSQPPASSELRLPNVRKIAVLRANGVGDLVFVLPALEALRAAYPAATITLLGKPWHAEFLAGRPGPVDRVVVVPTSRGVRDEPAAREDAAELERFFASMRQERFDLALQMHGGGRNSNPFVLSLGAGVTAGLRVPDAPILDRWVPYIYFQPEILRYLEVAALVGAAPATLEPGLALRPADEAEAARILGDVQRPMAVLSPGGGDGRRRWPADKFATVGDALAEAGARVVVTGSADEEDLTAAVVAGMHAPAVDLGGRLSLGALAALAARAAVVVANDSGPLHLARAVGTATVGIYWYANLVNAGPITRSRHQTALSWRLECPTCGRHCIHDNCQHHDSFVADVRAAEVQQMALDLLNSELAGVRF